MTLVPPRESVGAVVTAGGLGTRFGSLKQFADLGGRSVLARAVEVASRFASAIAIPLPPGHEATARSALAGHASGGGAGATGEGPGATELIFAEGGATRALSVLAGLKALPPVEWVLVHDAARPFATSDLFAEVISAAQRVGAAIPALPCSDTIKRTAEGLVVETLDRSALCLVQTPPGSFAAPRCSRPTSASAKLRISAPTTRPFMRSSAGPSRESRARSAIASSRGRKISRPRDSPPPECGSGSATTRIHLAPIAV